MVWSQLLAVNPITSITRQTVVFTVTLLAGYLGMRIQQNSPLANFQIWILQLTVATACKRQLELEPPRIGLNYALL